MTREERYPGAMWYEPITRYTFTFVPQPDTVAQLQAILPAWQARDIAQALAQEAWFAYETALLEYADLLDALALAAMPEPERSMAVTQEELDA